MKTSVVWREIRRAFDAPRSGVSRAHMAKNLPAAGAILLILGSHPAQAFQIRRDAVAALGASALNSEFRLHDTAGLVVAGRMDAPPNKVLWTGFWFPRAGIVSAIEETPAPDPEEPDSGEASITGLLAPETTRLIGVIPNPFLGQAEIRFDLAGAAGGSTPVRLDLYDVGGRLVDTPHDGVLAPGAHRIRWDPDLEGRGALPSGVYFLRFVSGRHFETLRVVKTR